MELPKLPQQNKTREMDFGVRLANWLAKNPISTASIEIKHTRGKNYFNYSELSDKQIAYAQVISGSQGVLIRVEGHNGEPDYIWMREEPAYIAIRYPGNTCLITINNLLYEINTRKQKSLTLQRAKEISSIVF